VIIYKITNKINSKAYIGQTILDIGVRWTKHCSKSGCKAIGNAIKKYGKENFKIEIIDTASSIEELNKKEEFHIANAKSMAPNGYNLRTGGLNSSPTPKTRAKIKKSLTGKKRPDDLKRKMSLIRQGNKLRFGTGKSVKCLNNGIIYRSAEDAAEQVGLSFSSVYKICKGIKGSIKGYSFEFVGEKNV
jgi:group I intron endonuclease